MAIKSGTRGNYSNTPARGLSNDAPRRSRTRRAAAPATPARPARRTRATAATPATPRPNNRVARATATTPRRRGQAVAPRGRNTTPRTPRGRNSQGRSKALGRNVITPQPNQAIPMRPNSLGTPIQRPIQPGPGMRPAMPGVMPTPGMIAMNNLRRRRGR